jgi:serine/threonine protein kinase
MTNTPTEAQQRFIDLYITGSRRQDAKMTKAFLEFDRRRGKTANCIAILPPNDPERARLQRLLDQATLKANGPDDRSNPNFEGAYKDLSAIKRDARASVKGFHKANSAQTIAQELARLERLVVTIRGNMEISEVTMQAAIDDIIAATPDSITEDEVEDFLRTVTSQEAGWRGMMGASERNTAVAVQAVTEMGAGAGVENCRHLIKQLAENGSRKDQAAVPELTQRLAALESSAKFGGASVIDAAGVRKRFDDQAKLFEEKLQGLKTLPSRDLRQDTGSRFSHLEAREKQILDVAFSQYHADFGNDQAVLDPVFRTKAAVQKAPPVLRQFHLEDLLEDSFTGTREDDLDENAIAEKAQDIEDNVQELIQREARIPNSDVLFDLTLKSLNELRLSLGEQLGLDADVESWPPKLRQLVETTARKIKAAVEASNPNKASDTTVTVTKGEERHEVPDKMDINGQTYDSPEMIGAGGMGKVMRYRLAGGGKDAPTVVVKSTLTGANDDFISDEDLAENRNVTSHLRPPNVRGAMSRQEMVKEARIHRLVCGGEDGTPSPNVIDLKGMATGKDGALFMIMEEAKSGDVNHLGKAMAGLVRAGVLPKAAQQALTQDTMVQAAKGLKAMQDIGLMHNDIKALNFFVNDDGTVKIADFGCGETREEAQEPDGPETTERFSAPEYRNGRDERSDVFALGAMLHNLDAPYGSEGTFGTMRFASQFGKNAPTGHDATSLDRLRNAMMDQDPAKRPTLEGVLMSSYVNDARDNFGTPEEQDSPLTALRGAMAQYVKVAGRDIAAVMTELGDLMATDTRLEIAAGKYPDQIPAFEEARQALPAKLKDIQDRLHAINARDDVAPLVKALQEAGQPFGTAEGKEKDRAWDFAYCKTQLAMDEIGTGTKDPKRPTSLPKDLKEELETAR